jgi:hypothetical protein
MSERRAVDSGTLETHMQTCPARSLTSADTWRAFANLIPPILLAALCLLGLGGTPARAQYTETIIQNPESPSPPDTLGWAVAMDGDTVAIGAPNIPRRTPGAVQVWTVDELGVSTLEAELVGDSPTDYNQFGRSVAISGDTLVVGARRAYDIGSVTDHGAVYIFVRSGGVWTQQAMFEYDGPAVSPLLFFGRSVAISGDTVVVGASDDTYTSGVPAPLNYGKTFVYTRSGDVWTLQQELIVPGKEVGACVAISGDLLLTTERRGGVYAFERSGGVWTEKQFLSAPSGYGAGFGGSLALTSDIAMIGEFDALMFETVFVFGRANGAWVKTQELRANPSGTDGQFGCSIVLSGDMIFIGAQLNDDNATNAGAVYVFTSSNGVWSEQQRLYPSDWTAGHFFGTIGVSGNSAVIGAYADSEKGIRMGAAYVFTNADGVWSEKQKLTTPLDTARGDDMGGSIAVSGETAVFGMPDDCEGALQAGAAYVFTKPFGSWIPSQKLIASDAAPDAGFGHSVAILDDTIIVGAVESVYPLGESGASGSAYIFRRNLSGLWTEVQKLTSPLPSGRDKFGAAVALSGDTAFVGAPTRKRLGGDSGAVMVFTSTGGAWTQTQTLVPSDDASRAEFGYAVAASGDTLVVGAPYSDVWAGAAYTYSNAGGVWGGEQKLSFSNNSGSDIVGLSVAISGDTALVGAYGDDVGATDSGSVYIFTREADIWTEQLLLVADDGQGRDRFGYAVSLSDDMLVATFEGNYSTGAYLCSCSGGVWTQSEKFTAVKGNSYGLDASPIAISDGEVFLGKQYSFDGGAVYLYSPPIVLPSAAADSWTLFE